MNPLRLHFAPFPFNSSSFFDKKLVDEKFTFEFNATSRYLITPIASLKLGSAEDKSDVIFKTLNVEGLHAEIFIAKNSVPYLEHVGEASETRIYRSIMGPTKPIVLRKGQKAARLDNGSIVLLGIYPSKFRQFLSSIGLPFYTKSVVQMNVKVESTLKPDVWQPEVRKTCNLNCESLVSHEKCCGIANGDLYPQPSD